MKERTLNLAEQKIKEILKKAYDDFSRFSESLEMNLDQKAAFTDGFHYGYKFDARAALTSIPDGRAMNNPG